MIMALILGSVKTLTFYRVGEPANSVITASGEIGMTTIVDYRISYCIYLLLMN